MPALIKTEWRVLVAHQGDIDEDAVEPAVDADKQVEEGAGYCRVIDRRKPGPGCRSCQHSVRFPNPQTEVHRSLHVIINACETIGQMLVDADRPRATETKTETSGGRRNLNTQLIA